MANTTFNTRLSLKIDNLTSWSTNGSKILLKGEVGFVTAAASKENGLTEPVVMMIVGDGTSTVADLLATNSFYAKASDVLEACKSEEALANFIKNHSSELEKSIGEAKTAAADAATAAANAASAAQTAQAAADAAQGTANGNTTSINKLTERVSKNETDISEQGETITTLTGDINSLKDKVRNVTSPMNFKGKKDVLPIADITDYNVGDVIVVGNKEYVFDSSLTGNNKWIELGDTTAEAGRLTTLEGYFENGIAKKATADANGNDISETYATSQQLSKAKESIDEKKIEDLKQTDYVIFNCGSATINI